MNRKYTIITLILFMLLGLSVFSACDGIRSSSTGDFVIDTDGVLIYYDGTDTKVQIPDTVTAINYTAFSENTTIRSVVMPDSVVEISESAFSGCTKLNDVTFSKSLSKIGDKAFYGCTSLTSVSLPNSVTTVGVRVFEGCTSLVSVAIGNGIISIPTKAFINCSSLQNVSFSENLKSIGERAFYGCKLLSDIDFPDSIESIGLQAFYNCPSLTAVYIPSGLTYVGAFDEKKCTISIKNQILISATADDYFTTLSSSIANVFNKEILPDNNFYATGKIDLLLKSDFNINLQIDIKVVYDRNGDEVDDEAFSITVNDVTGYFTGLNESATLFELDYFAKDKTNLYLTIFDKKFIVPFDKDISGSPFNGILETIFATFDLEPSVCDLDGFLLSVSESIGNDFDFYKLLYMVVGDIFQIEKDDFDIWLGESLGIKGEMISFENVLKENVFTFNGISKITDRSGSEIWKGYISDEICNGLATLTDGIVSDDSSLCVVYEIKNNLINNLYVEGMSILNGQGGKDLYFSVGFSDFSFVGLEDGEAPIAIDEFKNDVVFKKSSSVSFEEGQVKVENVNTLECMTLNGMKIKDILELYYEEYSCSGVQEFYEMLEIDVWNDFELNGRLNTKLYGNIVAGEGFTLDEVYLKFTYSDGNSEINLAEAYVDYADGEYRIKVKVIDSENDFVRVLKDFVVLNNISELIAEDKEGNDATIKELFNALSGDEFIIFVDEKDFTYKRLLGIYENLEDATALKTVSFVDTDKIIAEEGYVCDGGRYKLVVGVSDVGYEVTDSLSPYYGQKVEFYKEDEVEAEFSYVELYNKYSVRGTEDVFGLNLSTGSLLNVLFDLTSADKGCCSLNDLFGKIFGKNASYVESDEEIDLCCGIFDTGAEFDEEGNFVGYSSVSNRQEVMALILFSKDYVVSLTDAGILPAIKVDLDGGTYEKAYGKEIGVDGWCYQSAYTLSKDETMAIYDVIAKGSLSRETLEKLGLTDEEAIAAALGKVESCYFGGIVYKYLSVFGESALFKDSSSVSEMTDKILNLNIDFSAEINITCISYSIAVDGLFRTEKSIGISCDEEDLNLYSAKKAEFAF